jgi:hypothetical protein
MTSKVPAALAALGIALACAGSAQAATARRTPAKASATTVTTITACVKNKTGAVKILTAAQAKRRCAKGSTKLSWNVTGRPGAAGRNGANGTNGTNGTSGATGANGATGAPGPLLQVRDSVGSLGAFAGAVSAGGVPVYSVLAPDGGLYTYLPSGQVVPFNASGGFTPSPLFSDSLCSGTGFVNLGTGFPPSLIDAYFGGAARVVFRSSGAGSTFGPTRAWKFTSTTLTTPASPSFYELDLSTGACQAASTQPTAGNTLIALAAVTPPRDGIGALTIGG